MIVRSWDGLRTSAIAAELGCHQETVRKRLSRFNAEGLDGLGDRPGAGRKPRLTEAERSTLVRLARSTPPGRSIQWPDGTLTPVDERPEAPAAWTLDALVAAAGARGIVIRRSQVRRILLKERVRWRRTRSWTTSTDPGLARRASARAADPLPIGACWLNLQEGWWRLLRREAFAGQTFADDAAIERAVTGATARLNHRARSWGCGRPPPTARQ